MSGFFVFNTYMSVTSCDIQKKAMVEALIQSLGIVTDACIAVGISRQTHYRWLSEDEDYKAEVESIGDIALDFAESKLHNQIKNDNTIATIFYLKTKGKKRGYVERTELTGPDGQVIGGFNYITPATNGSHISNGNTNGKARRSVEPTNGQNH